MRRSNTSSGNGAGKKDFCAGLYTSGVSRSLGRRGPLSEPGRAALRAVKAVGACWRCKILRKKVCFLLQTASKTHLNSISAILSTLAKDAQRKGDHFGTTLGAGAERFHLKRNTLDYARSLLQVVHWPLPTYRISLP